MAAVRQDGWKGLMNTLTNVYGWYARGWDNVE